VTTDELDGVIAAPGNHKVLFENDEVRVLETTIAAGEITPLHTHLAPQVMYVVSGSHFVRRDEDGGTYGHPWTT
jgi:quercetin dioxygenase-like cupin family protein